MAENRLTSIFSSDFNFCHPVIYMMLINDPDLERLVADMSVTRTLAARHIGGI
jgi:hypothetical protein